jgi:hypothetical protein
VIDADRAAEWRTAWLQFAVLVLVAAVLLYLISPDKGLYAETVPPLLLVLGYRLVTVERLAPRLAQLYARAVVARAADSMLRLLATDRWLRDAWSQAGAPLIRLQVLPGERLEAAMRTLARDRYPSRRLTGPLHAANRVVALALGLGLGGLFAWAAAGTVCGRSPLALPTTLPGPIWAAVVLVVAARSAAAWYNRRRLTAVAEAMIANTRGELAALLAPPWTDRRVAVLGELDRLAEHGELVAAPRPLPELHVVDLLLAGGVAAGLVAGWTVSACP